MTYVVYSYVSSLASYGWSKHAKSFAGILPVPDGQDSDVVHNNSFLTLTKEVRFRGWTGIADCDASTASGLVECEP